MACRGPEPERPDPRHCPKAPRLRPQAAKLRYGLPRWVRRWVEWAVPDRSCTAFRPTDHNPAYSRIAERPRVASAPECASPFPQSPLDAARRWAALRGLSPRRAAETRAAGFAERWSESDRHPATGHKPRAAADISALSAPFRQIDVSSLGSRTCRAYMIAVCQDWHVQETPHDHRFANRLGRYRPAVST